MEEGQNRKYAEKWTVEKSLVFLDSVYSYLKKNKTCMTIVGACVALGHYEELFTYLGNKHDDENIFKSIRKSKDIVKARLIGKALFNETNSAMSIFVLKNNHGMHEKVQQETTLKGIREISILPASADTDKDK